MDTHARPVTLADPRSVMAALGFADEAGDADWFFETVWTKRHFKSVASAALMEELRSELWDFDVDAIFSRHAGKSAVWFETLDARYQYVEMSSRDALRFYKAGLTVYLEGYQTPLLRSLHSLLGQFFGRPSDNLLCSLFASKAGAGTGCHFDQVENFTIQLVGEKTWQVAPNTSVAYPLENYSARHTGASQPGFDLYRAAAFPQDIPGDATTLRLLAGEVAYLPRGIWHRTSTTSADSLSIALSFPVSTWMDLVMPALRTLLSKETQWRENMLYSTDPKLRRRARRSLEGLLSRLARDVRNLDPDDMLPAAPAGDRDLANPACRLSRHALASVTTRTASQGDIEVESFIHHGKLSRARTAVLPGAWKGAFEWALQRQSFSLDELANANGCLPRAQQAQLLEVMLQLECLRVEARPCVDDDCGTASRPPRG